MVALTRPGHQVADSEDEATRKQKRGIGDEATFEVFMSLSLKHPLPWLRTLVCCKNKNLGLEFNTIMSRDLGRGKKEKVVKDDFKIGTSIWGTTWRDEVAEPG